VGHLKDAGAKVYIADINEAKLKETTEKYGAEVIALDNMWNLDMDIYAPCALGATVNTESIHAMKCSIIAGAANNQLAVEKEHGQQLIKKGIIYAPDFLINAGGLINVSAEIGIYNKERVLSAVEKIYSRLQDCLTRAEANNITAQESAMQMAEERLGAMKELRSKM
jgi:leucine dehydrogenase